MLNYTNIQMIVHLCMFEPERIIDDNRTNKKPPIKKLNIFNNLGVNDSDDDDEIEINFIDTI